jgi:hypothetical protein
MIKQILISFLMVGALAGAAQQITSKPVAVQTVDDRDGGYILFTYTVPEDGLYTFTVDGGLITRHDCTVYYYEYLLLLESQRKSYMQDKYNIGSQAQDGNVCYFHTNDKDNKISGNFCKDEVVQLRLVMLKTDVNGQPHNKLQLARNSSISIELNKEALTAN